MGRRGGLAWGPRPGLGLWAVLLSCWVLAAASRPGPGQDAPAPGKGVFLVAGPDMADPRFRQSVILLVEHGEDGSLGFIVNRTTDVPLSRVLPESVPGGESHRLFFGGPVQVEGLMFLSRSDEPLEGASRVMEEVYFGADRGLLEKLLRGRTDPARLRVFAGYSGWGSGQLAGEIARDDWSLVRADAGTVFEKPTERIWPDLVEPARPEGRFIARAGPVRPLPGRAGTGPYLRIDRPRGLP